MKAVSDNSSTTCAKGVAHVVRTMIGFRQSADHEKITL